jgi:hypothetical protein
MMLGVDGGRFIKECREMQEAAPPQVKDHPVRIAAVVIVVVVGCDMIIFVLTNLVFVFSACMYCR